MSKRRILAQLDYERYRLQHSKYHRPDRQETSIRELRIKILEGQLIDAHVQQQAAIDFYGLSTYKEQQ